MIDKQVWDYLLDKINNEYGVAGLMGNIYAESGMITNRVEILCLTRLAQAGQRWTDETYTAAIDSGKINRATFLNPLPGKQYGYGLCQWTSPGRKAGLYDLAKSKGKSIADINIQLEWLLTELANSYPTVLRTLKNAKSVQEASDIVLIKFESPANVGTSVKNQRAGYGMTYYNKYKNSQQSTTTSSTGKYDKYIYSTTTHYISNSGSDENGGYANGRAGDQTGNEWSLRSWYSRPWNCVLRYEKNPNVGIKLAELGCAAALNNNIGYDQNERYTYWDCLKRVGYDPSNISTPCEGDCSAGVIANTKAVGYLLGIPALQNINATYTGNMKTAYKSAGFTVLTGSKYTNSTEYLLPGDILLNELHHTATNITKGTKAINSNSTSNSESSTSSSGNTSYCGKGIGTATAKCEMNIRSGNGTNYNSYGTIPRGTKVEVLEKTSNSWYKIVWPGASCGYAYTAADNEYYSYIANKTSNTTTSAKKITASKSADYFKKLYAGTYTVVTGSDTLNVRDGAGTNNKVLVSIPSGTKVKNYGYYSKSGSTVWLYIQFTYKNIIYTGFASKDYLQ